MDAIMTWVTQIIIFILLATIIDLLTPKSTFKKYIQLVVGLILILVFLKPVFYVFNMDIEEALKASYQQLDEAETKMAESEKQSEFQKKDIQDSQDAYILEQMTSKLKELAEPPLKNELDLEIAHISYDFAEGEDKTLETLQQMTVSVQPSQESEDAVEPVNDININTQPSDKPKSKKLQDVKAILKDTWEMDDKRLEIQWEGGIP